MQFKNKFNNPFIEYLHYLYNRWRIKLKYPDVKQRYLAIISKDSSLGTNIKIEERSLIVESQIGSYSYVSNNTTIYTTSVGKFCCIGANCTIGLANHPTRDFVSSHPIFFSTRKQLGFTFADKDYINEMKGCRIENDVWIGNNVLILGGITIGNGAVIGAGAVVTKDVPSYSIYGGVPAKLIRYRFDQKRINFLQEFQWWNKSEQWLKSNFKNFHDVDKFIDSVEKHDFSI